MLTYHRTLLRFFGIVCFTLLLWYPTAAHERVLLEDDPGPPTGDAFTPPPSPTSLEGFYDEPSGPSQFMAGNVAVLLILPESDGSVEPSLEDWTPQQIAAVTQQAQAALDWWPQQLPLARLQFNLEVRVIPTGFEPITHGIYEEGLWIGDVLGKMGYSGTYFERAYAAVYDLRRQRQSDWATIIFVANSAHSTSGRFSDNGFGYAYIGGPFMVLTSDAGPYGTRNLAPVIAHEMGHIFGALDQYSVAQIPCSRRSGYLYTPTTNSQVGGCPTNLPSIMLSPLSAYNAGAVDPSAQAQVGYLDSDGDGIIDPLDTTPRLVLDPIASYQPGQRPYISGQSTDVGYPSSFQRTVSINAIARVEYRADGGPWQPAIPGDGAFDSANETFHIEAPLYDGTHHLEFRTTNTVGNSSPLSSVTVDVSGVGPQPAYRMRAPELSNTRMIALDLEAPADTQAVQISADPLFASVAWQPYASPLSYEFVDADDGRQQIYARFRDAAGYTSQTYSQTIILDTQPPTGQVVLQRGATTRAILSAEDQGSGVAEIELQVNDGAELVQISASETTTPSDGAIAAWQPYHAEVPLPRGTTAVRARFRDAAGNVSSYCEAEARDRIYLPLIVAAP